MTVKNILDSIYIIPVILDHLKEPTPITKKILREHDISPVMVENMREIAPLLSYHLQTVKSDFASSNGNYDLLRHGLKKYFNLYLSEFFTTSTRKDLMVLDYGSGDGQIANLIKELNPSWKVYTLDRHDRADIVVDFEVNPEWYLKYIDKFDLIIMSELLHCKQTHGQRYLIDSSYALLKKGGQLFVIENEDYCMAYRISKLKNIQMTVITEDHLAELCEKQFRMKDYSKIHNHTLFELEKI